MHMGTSYVAALVLLVLASPSSAQDAAGGLWGFPTNPVKGGWARYVVDTETGPRTMVIRCRGPGKDARGRAGQRYELELELPDTARMSLRLLLKGKTASPENVLRMEVVGPDGKVRPVEDDAEDGGEEDAQPVPAALAAARVQVGAAAVEVAQWRFPDGTRLGWSAKVPGLGLVYVVGESRMALVAMGVGGDPWKGAGLTAFWPEGMPPSP